MIILTSAEASHVRGMSEPGAELQPTLLADSVTYVLPEDVLTDPAHERKRAYLAALPTRIVSPDEYVQPSA